MDAKRAIPGCAGILCMPLLAVGCGARSAAEPPVSGFPFIRLEGNTELQVRDGRGQVMTLARTGPSRVRSLTVYDPNGKTVFYTIHHRGGSVKELAVLVAGAIQHRWGFYESGSLQFVSKFLEASSSGYVETRQFYDEGGNPTESKAVCGRCVD